MSALIMVRWPAVSRRLLITAGVFFGAALIVALLVQVRAFDSLDRRILHYVQGRGSFGQDVGLGLLTYLGSIEVTLLIALLLAFPLFKGLRLLAIGPAAVILLASALEWLGKHTVHEPAPGLAFQRFPNFLPKLTHHVDPYAFPSGHMLRTTLLYGLLLYLADRWELFGPDSSRLSPVLVPLILLVGYAVVYLGWHWFADVVGGLLFGLALLIGMIAYLERKRVVNP